MRCASDLGRDEVNETVWVKSFDGHEVVDVYSGAGCPAYSLNQLFIFFDQIRIVIGILLLPPGLIILAKGRQRIHVTIFISNAISLQFFFMYLMYAIFLSKNRTAWIDWVNLSIWIVVGAAASLFLTRRRLKYSIFIQAVFAGCILAMLFMTATQIPL